MTPKFSSIVRALLTIALSLASVRAQEIATIGPAAQVASPRETYRYPNGETLHYTADWRLWPAGVATLRMEQAGGEQRITATANSTGVVATLYRVSDTFVSRFDARSFCSIAYSKHAEEGLRKRETMIQFDAARRKAVLDERNLRDNSVKHAENEIPSCATDVLSGIYYPRTLPLQPGATYLFPLNNGARTVDVKAHVEGREEIKTELGLFRTVRVCITSDAETLKGRGKIWIWYTEDDSHIPVQMRSRLFWGTMTLRLTQMEK